MKPDLYTLEFEDVSSLPYCPLVFIFCPPYSGERRRRKRKWRRGRGKRRRRRRKGKRGRRRGEKERGGENKLWICCGFGKTKFSSSVKFQQGVAGQLLGPSQCSPREGQEELVPSLSVLFNPALCRQCN